MLQIRPFRSEDTPEILALWNACIGKAFPLTERLFRQNVLEDPFQQPEGNLVALWRGQVTGWALARVLHDLPPEILDYEGIGSIGAFCVHPEHRGKGIGSALFEAAMAFLRDHKPRKLTLTRYPFHLLPGVPQEAPGLREFLERHGFAFSHTVYDVIRDLEDFRLPRKARSLLASRADVEIRPGREGEEAAILAFLARVFPGGWQYDRRLFFARGGSPADLVLLVVRGEIHGFAHIFTSKSPWLGGSVHWFPLLGEHWGGLGPIGISPEVRGQGLGFALLCRSLEILRTRGVRRAVIDWIEEPLLLGFYRKAGFRAWKRYALGERPGLYKGEGRA